MASKLPEQLTIAAEDDSSLDWDRLSPELRPIVAQCVNEIRKITASYEEMNVQLERLLAKYEGAGA